MSGRSVVRMQKKLQELESELADVFRRPLDPTASDPRRQMPFDDIKQRFNFLTKLLAAEIDTQPQISDELHEIDQRLTQLKAAFRDWNKSRSCIFNKPDDTLSICSDCTQALLYDDDDVGESGSEPEEEFAGEKSPEKFVEKDERGEEVRIWSKRGKYCGVFGCGVIVGAIITICMAVKLFSSSDNVIEYEAFLLPPPT